jgi:hypothetical protein
LGRRGAAAGSFAQAARGWNLAPIAANSSLTEARLIVETDDVARHLVDHQQAHGDAGAVLGVAALVEPQRQRTTRAPSRVRRKTSPPRTTARTSRA